MKKIIFIGLFLLMVSCSSSLGVSNDSHSDISLSHDSKEYIIKKRLKEINTESVAIWGIPMTRCPNKKQGFGVRFNGINLTAPSRIGPILSFVVLNVVTFFAVNSIVGWKTEIYYDGKGTTTYSDVPKMSALEGTLISAPIAGFLNNQMWKNSALNMAAWEANRELLIDDKDEFLIPKYEIETSRKIWTQHAKIKVRVLGAKIKTDN